MSSLDDRHVALQGGGHLHLHLQHPPPPYTVALILSFDDISLLFLYFRYRIESTLAPPSPVPPSLSLLFHRGVSKLARKSIKSSRLCNSITYRSSDSLLDLSMMYWRCMYICIYISIRRCRVDLCASEKGGSEKRFVTAKGERCPFVERRSNKNRTRIDNWS